MSYCPLQVSETPDKPVEDCAPSSDEMAVMKATFGTIPADLSIAGRRAERERIRTATGHPHGGLNIADINRANRALYGAELEVLSISFTAFIADHMDQDDGAVLLGSASQLPKHYNRWDPAFGQAANSGHAMYTQGASPDGKRYPGHCWLMNPLAPWWYPGEWIANQFLRAYAWGIGQSGLVAEGAWLISGGPSDMALLAMKPDAQTLLGSATTNAAGTSYILADGTRQPVTGGTLRNVLGVSQLDAPIDGHPGDRQTLLLVSIPGNTPGWGYLLADDTDWPVGKAPSMQPADCSAAVQMRDLQWIANLTPPK